MRFIPLIVFFSALCTSAFAEIQDLVPHDSISISAIEFKGNCNKFEVISMPKEVIKYYISNAPRGCKIKAVHTGSLAGKSVALAEIETFKRYDGNTFTVPESVQKITFK